MLRSAHEDDDLGLAYLPVIVPIAAATFSLLLVRASWITYTHDLKIPRESEAQKQLWSFKQQVMNAWSFTADELPRQALVTMLDQLQRCANRAVITGSVVRTSLSGSWTKAAAVSEARVAGWEQAFGSMRLAAISAPATRTANGVELISTKPFKSLRDHVSEFIIDTRAYSNDLEYASLNDTWQFPWAASILELLESFMTAVFNFLMSAGNLIVQLLQLMAELARQLALALKRITNWLPLILGGVAVVVAGGFGYRHFHQRRRRL